MISKGLSGIHIVPPGPTTAFRMAGAIRALALVLATVGSCLLSSGCGTSEESGLMQAYEVQVEPLLKEDEPVGQRIEDLRKEFEAGNSTAEDFLPFAKTTGLPFYAAIATRAQAIEPGFPELVEVHGLLLQFIELRREYLATIVRVFESGNSEPMRRLAEAHSTLNREWQALAAEARAATGDLELARAIGEFQAYEKRIAMFRSGGVSREVMESELREGLIPTVQRLAEKMRPMREASGFDGAAARWSVATLNYYESVVGTLGQIEKFIADSGAADQAYTASVALRAEFLNRLRALRERLR